MTAASSWHPDESELVLHVYGDSSAPEVVERHLAVCIACAAEYRAIVETVAAIPEPAVPERGDHYGLEVWQRIRPLLPAEKPGWQWLWTPTRMVAALGAVAALVMIAYLAGRAVPAPAPAPMVASRETGASVDAAQARFAATADHLEQSERVLLEVANAEGPAIDISLQQETASDLVDANRLYREAAVQAGDGPIAALLDELERTLLNLVHSPSTLTPAQLEPLRARLDAAALLFKVRILSNELREREHTPLPRRSTT